MVGIRAPYPIKDFSEFIEPEPMKEVILEEEPCIDINVLLSLQVS